MFGAILLLTLTGCGSRQETVSSAGENPAAEVSATLPPTGAVETAVPIATTSPTAAEEPPSTPAPAVMYTQPGTYTWETDGAIWMLMLRDTGLFTLMERTEEGDDLHSGEGWQDNGDGTVTCGPAQIDRECFSRKDGSSVWRILDNGLCEPVLP